MSTNFDIAGEWYYSKGNALTFDAFWKNVDGFVTSEVVPGVVIPTVTNTQLNTFTVTRPTNAQAVQVWGVTGGITHSFAFGAGVQLNYTATFSNRGFDGQNFDPTVATLPGLSDSANAVVFYEKGPLAARVAYNWRNSFLRATDFAGGAYGSVLEPRFAGTYQQVDARVSYKLLKNIQVYAEGVNLTNAILSEHGRFDNLFISRQNYGRRIIVGVGAKF